MHLARERLGRLFGRDAHCLTAVDVHERGRDFAPVAELQRALAETTAGDHGDRVGGATVDLHKGDQTLAVLAAGILNAELRQAKHGQAHAQNLTGAEVSVRLLSVTQIFVERFHRKPSSVNSKPNNLTKEKTL